MLAGSKPANPNPKPVASSLEIPASPISPALTGAKRFRVLPWLIPPPRVVSGMALSSSFQVLQRALRPWNSSLLEGRAFSWPISRARFSVSSLFGDDDNRSPPPPLTGPKLFVRGDENSDTVNLEEEQCRDRMRSILFPKARLFSCSSLLIAGHRASRCFYSVPLQPQDLILFAQGYRSVVNQLSKNPRDPKSLASLDSMLTQTYLLDSSTSVLVLRGLSLCRKFTRAKTLLSHLKQKGTIPDLFLFTLVLQCLLPDGQIRDVESVWEDISPGSATSASDFIVQLCQRSEGAVELERVCRRISSSKHNLSPEAYTALIGALCEKRNSNPFMALQVLREMDEKGFPVDSFTYFTLFRSFCRTGNVFEADSVLRGLAAKANFELDASIYENFLQALCRSGKLREARKLFDKMRKRNYTVGMDSVPNLKRRRRLIFQLKRSTMIAETVAFGSYLRALCSAGEVDEAEKLLEEAKEANVMVESCDFAHFLQALFRAGRADEAMKIYEIRIKRGSAFDSHLASAVIIGLCEIIRVDEAYKLLLDTITGGHRPTYHVWNCILDGYLKQGRLEEAVRLFERMRAGDSGSSSHSSPDASTYSVMVRGTLQNGDFRLAISIFEEMIQKKVAIDVSLCTAVLRGLCSNGKLEDAQKHLNKLIETGILVSYTEWESLYYCMSVGDGPALCEA